MVTEDALSHALSVEKSLQETLAKYINKKIDSGGSSLLALPLIKRLVLLLRYCSGSGPGAFSDYENATTGISGLLATKREEAIKIRRR